MYNKDMKFFNWDELLVAGRKDFSAIICLLYGETNCYNYVSAKTFMYKLNINKFPLFLFKARYFTQHTDILQCNYKTTEPQTYYINPIFLYANVSVKDKVQYIKALSLRRPSNRTNYIPRHYMGDLSFNPFLELTKDKIIFSYEPSL